MNIEDNREILGGLVKHARRLYIESDHFSITDDSGSEINPSLEIDSIATSTRFAFDNEIIASRTYQKALAYLHRIESRQAEFEADTSVTPAAAQTVGDVVTGEDSETETMVAVPTREHVSRYQDSTQILSNEPDPEVSRSKSSRIHAGTATRSAHSGNSETDLNDTILTDIPMPTARSQSDTWMSTTGLTSSSPASWGTNSNDSITPSSSVPRAKTTSSGETGGLFLDKRFNGIWAQIAVRRKYLGTISAKLEPARKILWVGDGACGKSFALMSGVKGVYLDGKYFMGLFDEYEIDTYLDDYHISLKLQDTPGQEDYDSSHKIYYPGSTVVVIGYDISCKDSLENVSEKVS